MTDHAALSDLDLAELAARLGALGLDPGRSTQAHLQRVGALLEELRRSVRPDQFQVLLWMIRKERGGLEPLLTGLIHKARDGSLFLRPARL